MINVSINTVGGGGNERKNTHDSFQGFLLFIHFLHPQNVVGEIERLETVLLPEESNNGASGPVQTLTEQLPVNTTKRSELI